MNVEERPESSDGTDGMQPGVSSDSSLAPAEVTLQTRRAVIPSIVVGVVALVVAGVIGRLLAGIGICLGLAFGMFNARLLQASVLHRFAVIGAQTGQRTNFLASGATRLAAITLAAILLVVFVRPLGFGVLIGLVVFQVTMIGAAAAAMYRQVRQ